MPVLQTKDTLSPIYHDALRIRTDVFVKEQGVPITEEIDAFEAYSIHLVYYNDENSPLGTCRLLPIEHGQIKLQRMAVRLLHRKQHIGQQLIEHALSFSKKQGFKEMVLGAQLQAIPFYKTLGFETYGPIFLDATIKHQMMKKTIA